MQDVSWVAHASAGSTAAREVASTNSAPLLRWHGLAGVLPDSSSGTRVSGVFAVAAWGS